jgi:ADP-heptose:LPS heptosyltransferase
MSTRAAAGSYRNYSRRARRIARLLDVAAVPVAPLLRRLAPAGAAPNPPRSILVVRLDHLGDVLMSTPALAALRAAFPAARIDVLAAPWGRAALDGNPHIDEVLLAEAPWYDPRLPELPRASFLAAGRMLHRRGYDWGFDFRGDPRVVLFQLLPGARRRFGFARLGLERLLTDAIPYDRGRSQLDLCLDLVAHAGAPAAGRRPVFRVQDADRARAAGLLADAGFAAEARPVVVAPSSNRASARWTAAGFAGVVDGLAELGLRSVLVGRKEDAGATQEVLRLARSRPADLTGKTSLQELAAVLERAALLVVNDSGPAHLAAAVGCKTVAIFGPTECPYEDGTAFVGVRSQFDHPRPCLNPRCDSDHGLPALSAGEVLRAARRVLAGTATLGSTHA